MNIVKADNLACPIDGLQLEIHEKCLTCRDGHAFDISRQGYVNLLPVQHKRSKHPGDSKEMVAARSEFLNSGFYEAIAQQLVDIISRNISGPGDVCILDAGCGEGYYLDVIFNNLKANSGEADLSFIGLDISKPAISTAAKRNKMISWIVGTNRQPPVSCSSVDIVICVFGFQSFKGFAKILKRGGKIILVDPGPDHLKELREIIYTEIKKSDPYELSSVEEMGFFISDRKHFQYKTLVSSNRQINNLLVMTPHLYRANIEGREIAYNLKTLDITVDVVVRIFEKE